MHNVGKMKLMRLMSIVSTGRAGEESMPLSERQRENLSQLTVGIYDPRLMDFACVIGKADSLKAASDWMMEHRGGLSDDPAFLFQGDTIIALVATSGQIMEVTAAGIASEWKTYYHPKSSNNNPTDNIASKEFSLKTLGIRAAISGDYYSGIVRLTVRDNQQKEISLFYRRDDKENLHVKIWPESDIDDVNGGSLVRAIQKDLNLPEIVKHLCGVNEKKLGCVCDDITAKVNSLEFEFIRAKAEATYMHEKAVLALVNPSTPTPAARPAASM